MTEIPIEFVLRNMPEHTAKNIYVRYTLQKDIDPTKNISDQCRYYAENGIDTPFGKSFSTWEYYRFIYYSTKK